MILRSVWWERQKHRPHAHGVSSKPSGLFLPVFTFCIPIIRWWNTVGVVMHSLDLGKATSHDEGLGGIFTLAYLNSWLPVNTHRKKQVKRERKTRWWEQERTKEAQYVCVWKSCSASLIEAPCPRENTAFLCSEDWVHFAYKHTGTTILSALYYAVLLYSKLTPTLVRGSIGKEYLHTSFLSLFLFYSEKLTRFLLLRSSLLTYFPSVFFLTFIIVHSSRSVRQERLGTPAVDDTLPNRSITKALLISNPCTFNFIQKFNPGWLQSVRVIWVRECAGMCVIVVTIPSLDRWEKYRKVLASRKSVGPSCSKRNSSLCHDRACERLPPN